MKYIYVYIYKFRTRRSSVEERNLLTHLEQKPIERLIDSMYDTESPLYWLTMAVMLTPYSKWISTNRLMHLNKIILMAHVYHTNSSIAPNIRSIQTTPHDYAAYKPSLMFFALINTMYEYYFKVTIDGVFLFYVTIFQHSCLYNIFHYAYDL